MLVVVDLHFILIFILSLYLYFFFDLHLVVVLSFITVLHSHLLFDIILHPSVDYRRVFAPLLYFQSSSLQGNSRHFHFQSFR